MIDLTFMVDIETTGVDVNNCKLLQIALLPLEFNEYFTPYKPTIPSFISGNFNISSDGFVFTQKYAGIVSEFGKKYQSELYTKCSQLTHVDASLCAEEIRSYVKLVGGTLPFQIAGKNIGVFDLPILSRLDYLIRDTDYHYRIEDMSGCFKLAQRVTGKTKEELEKIALDITPIVFAFPGKEHEALSDCYRQAAIYNGLIKLLRNKN